MPTLTIRDIDDALKRSLRMRAASMNRSMEEEARQILRAALAHEPSATGQNLMGRIRARVAPFGGLELPLAPREAVRIPPAVGDPAPALPQARTAAPSKAPVSGKSRRRSP